MNEDFVTNDKFFEKYENSYSLVVRNFKNLSEIYNDLFKDLKKVSDYFFILKRFDIISSGFIKDKLPQEVAFSSLNFLQENYPHLKPYIVKQIYLEKYLFKVYSPLKGKIYEDGISFFIKENKIMKEYKFLWDDLFLVAGAQVEEQEDKIEHKQELNISIDRHGIRKTYSLRSEKVKKKHKDYYLDMIFMYEDGYKHLRVEMLDFKFGFLGLKLKPSRFENFMNFLQYIVDNGSEDTIIDESAQYLLDGNIHTNLRFSNRRIYTYRLINLLYGKGIETAKVY